VTERNLLEKGRRRGAGGAVVQGFHSGGRDRVLKQALEAMDLRNEIYRRHEPWTLIPLGLPGLILDHHPISPQHATTAGCHGRAAHVEPEYAANISDQPNHLPPSGRTAPPVNAVHESCSSEKAWNREIRLSVFKS
jgi:hypothetical protein